MRHGRNPPDKPDFGLLPYTIVVPIPAVGTTPADVVVPTGEIWRMESVGTQCTNAAVVASRYFFLDILADGVNITHEYASNQAIPTTVTARFHCSTQTISKLSTSAASAVAGGVSGVILGERAIIRIGYNAMNAGDQFTASTVRYFKWKDYEFKGHEWS